jgi:N,N-dimethylformamidase
MRRHAPLSPVPGVSLRGYPQELSVPTGSTVELMVGGEPGEARLRLTRLIHGDPNPAGPGVKEEAVDWGVPAVVQVEDQVLDEGSYVEVPPERAPSFARSFTLALWLRPTALSGDRQALVSRWGADPLSFGLFVTGSRTLTAGVSHDGRSVQWCTGRAWIAPGEWQFVAACYDAAAGRLALYQSGSTGPAKSFADQPLDTTTKLLDRTGPLHEGDAPLLMGALAPLARPGPHWAHYNGKLARIQLIDGALAAEAIQALRDAGELPGHPAAVAAWDFSREISGERVVDVAGSHHGVAVNVPGRGVTGPGWVGTDATMYADRPHLYDAIQLHDDDVGDAGWSATATVDVPASAVSGFYAATFERERDRCVVPFIVSTPRSEAAVRVLVPTFTWQAYSSNRGPWSYTEDGLVDPTPCIYDQHRDGSMVYYVSRRRPTRSHQPSAGFPVWGSHNLTANLYLIDWLEATGFPYSLTTDDDLHRDGVAVLEGARALIIGSHPEYWTGPMLDALRDHLEAGGRCLYLGGNGLYWVTSVDRQRPYVIEVRKSGDWYDWWAHPTPGELAHSSTLEPGGKWSRRGRPARRLVGVEMAANCFTDPPGPDGRGYRRLPASYEPDCAFVFEGLGDEPIGNFGLNLGSAASYEMDAALEMDAPADMRRIVLAEASDDSFIPLDRTPVRPRSELVLTTISGGGAVFAAGSVSWTGSLSHNDYANGVSRITANVIRRFIETPPGESVLSA